MKTKVLPGKINITRPIDPRVDYEYISITIQDYLSHGEIVEVKVPLEQFSKAITGQAYQDCEVHYPPQKNIGKVRENKSEFVPFDSPNYKVTEEELNEALKPFEVDGWKGRREDLTNHHNRGNLGGLDGYNVVFVRYIEKDDS